MSEVKYKRVLLKLSGESMCAPGGFGIDSEQTKIIAERIINVCKLGPKVAIVIGGGNFLRGSTFSKGSHICRYTADQMGMLATIMNACAMKESLEYLGQPAVVLSALHVNAVCEPLTRRGALEHFEQGKVVLLAGGTGSPFFSTDSGAALRAAELDIELIIKATKVDGVYTDDPKINPDAKMYTKLTFRDVLKDGLKVIDPAAMSLCSESDIPVIVLNIFKEGNITKALKGEQVGTLISNG